MGTGGTPPSSDGDRQTSACSGGLRQGKEPQSPVSRGKLFQGLEMELKSSFPCPSGENEPDFPLPALPTTCELSLHSSVPQFPQQGRCWGGSACCSQRLQSKGRFQHITISSETRNQMSLQAGAAGEPPCPACSAKSQAFLMLKAPRSPHGAASGCNFPVGSSQLSLFWDSGNFMVSFSCSALFHCQEKLLDMWIPLGSPSGWRCGGSGQLTLPLNTKL